ncbi:hypothetical protein T4A_8615 [Trichinella pseudospiralis]|uniref:Uncharacterized protein n=1 Tax=Trichinella pseudospiralis TaxID=6337 RepID=A0A0V1DJB1_TRIPS|nr:hypothetical protein T4A_8615 [Trichinella pseudospiralis]
MTYVVYYTMLNNVRTVYIRSKFLLISNKCKDL